jgi:4-aminobutyrate aminotransferase-like enzyme
MSLQFATPELNQRIVHQCVKNGLITDWFLFAADRLRIAPPLITSMEDLDYICKIILQSIEEIVAEKQ